MSEPNERGIDDRADREDVLSTADLAGARTPAPIEADRDPGFEAGPDVRGEPSREPRTFAARDDDQDAAPVFPSEEADGLRQQWDSIQASFVDEPRRAVEEADHLVAATMQRLAESFADERAKLEGQWDRGDDVSTEDLRVALRRYRSFFGRLLSA